MATEAETRVWSDVAIPVGELLLEELETIGMTQLELARRTGRPPQVINEIIRGKKGITEATALGLEKVLGIPAHIWVNLESAYNLTLAKQRERAVLAQEVGRLEGFPIREMEKRGWLQARREKPDKVRALLEFLGVASFDALEQTVAGFRLTGGGQVSQGALAVWLRKGELEGNAVATEPFDNSRFKEALTEIRGFTARNPQDFLPRMRELCAAAGVAVVCVRELPKGRANGAARWLNPHKALIQLSLRWHWADIFWVSFFHEACHVLRHQVKRVCIEGLNGDTQEELEANSFARDFLVHPAQWSSFILAGDWSPYAVQGFATDNGIAPGVVVGRMHHESIIPYDHLTGLKQRFVWVDKAGETDG